MAQMNSLRSENKTLFQGFLTIINNEVITKTARTYLRKLNKKDVQVIYSLYSNHQALKYWSHAPFNDISQAKKK